MDITQLNSNFFDYTILKSLSVTTDFESKYFESNLAICLCRDEYLPEDYIDVEFVGVSQLRVNDIGGGLTQMCHLRIDDIRASQLDRLNYKITDCENDVISFCCSSINIRDTRNITRC